MAWRLWQMTALRRGLKSAYTIAIDHGTGPDNSA
jgi:hypothetical protein